MARDWDQEKSPTARAYANVCQATIDEVKQEQRIEILAEIATLEASITRLRIDIDLQRQYEVENEKMETRSQYLSSLMYTESEAQNHLIVLKRKLKALG